MAACEDVGAAKVVTAFECVGNTVVVAAAAAAVQFVGIHLVSMCERRVRLERWA